MPEVLMAPYDPSWPERFDAESAQLMAAAGPSLLQIEHIGSTAVPGLCAKPVIDMMAVVGDLSEGDALVACLEKRGYWLIQTGMADRLVFRRGLDGETPAFQLHVVALASWEDRHERLMRDYLMRHPNAAAAYGDLKIRLAEQYVNDLLAYTKAKTAFIQNLVDQARAQLGLPPIHVWPD